jgi:hypothetical protein
VAFAPVLPSLQDVENMAIKRPSRLGRDALHWDVDESVLNVRDGDMKM